MNLHDIPITRDPKLIFNEKPLYDKSIKIDFVLSRDHFEKEPDEELI